MIDVNYNEYKETIAQNMKLVVENHNLKEEIERLNKENNILKKNAEHNDKVVDNVNWENMLLKKRIDKAIEYIEQHRIGNEYSYEYDLFQRNARTSDLLNILKGVDKE